MPALFLLSILFLAFSILFRLLVSILFRFCCDSVSVSSPDSVSVLSPCHRKIVGTDSKTASDARASRPSAASKRLKLPCRRGRRAAPVSRLARGSFMPGLRLLPRDERRVASAVARIRRRRRRRRRQRRRRRRCARCAPSCLLDVSLCATLHVVCLLTPLSACPEGGG